MLYRARHTTLYRYAAPVSQCLSEVRLTPRALPWQTVLERSIETTPRAASLDERKDYYGNSVSLLSILERHDQFSTVATSLVRVDARPEMTEATPAWEQVREDVAAQRTAEAIDAVEFVFDSPYVTTGPELAAFAGGSFTAGRPLMAALSDMTHRIHHEFTYKPTTTTIAPAIVSLRQAGLDVIGPLSADTMFHAEARQLYDAAVAMYHDQALIPLKTLAFDRGINVTLGLPFVRTSPDHGTAFDIAGTGRARPTSFIEALRLAQRLGAGNIAP